MEQLTATYRVDLLKHLYKRARNEIDFLRKREEGYFDPSRDEPLFPERWKQRGKRELKLKKRILSVNYVSATALLGVLAVAMIWLNGR